MPTPPRTPDPQALLRPSRAGSSSWTHPRAAAGPPPATQTGAPTEAPAATHPRAAAQVPAPTQTGAPTHSRAAARPRTTHAATAHDVVASRHSLTGALLLAALLTSFLGACGSDAAGDGTWAGSVQDSAGIKIVTSPAQGVWTDETAWRVHEELRIGVAEGDPELQFGLLTGVDVDPEGRIYALDSQAGRVRVFGPDGELITAFGRIGDGPGELSQGALGPFVGESGNLLVADMASQRLARFAPGGDPLPSARFDLTLGIPLLWTRTPDREVVVQVRRMDVPGMIDTGGAQPTDFILTLDDEGAVLDTLASFPSGETIDMAGGMPRIRIFAPERVWTVLEGPRVVEGINSEYSLHVRGVDGGVTTVLRREFTRRPVRDTEIRSMRDAFRTAWEEAGIPPEASEQFLANIEFEEQWPALAALQSGPDGTLWVQRVDPEMTMDLAAQDLMAFQPGSQDWDVFDAEGRYLGVVEMPTGFTPTRIASEFMVGIHRDDLGVQRIVRLALERP